jgi:hypothetical protein
MRYALILTLVGTLWTTAAYAQETHGYVEGNGGISSLTGVKSGGAIGEVGIKIAPNVMLFGNVGNIRDTGSSSLQASIDQAVSDLAANNDLTVTGTSRVPAWYSMGGARIQFPGHRAVTPYVFGSVGFAKLSPTIHFNYESGTTPTGNVATAGDDITNDIVANGLFSKPTSTRGLMLRTGGGVQVPLGRYLLGNVSYSVSRISSDTPIHGQDVTFGLGFKF